MKKMMFFAMVFSTSFGIFGMDKSKSGRSRTPTNQRAFPPTIEKLDQIRRANREEARQAGALRKEESFKQKSLSQKPPVQD